MAKIIDLTGKIFGRLTVIKQSDYHVNPNGTKATKWLCKCECGKEKSIMAASLKNGTKSCGCLIKQRNAEIHLIDLTGKEFGRLTVISRGEDRIRYDGSPEAKWICKCSCGNIVNIDGASLRDRETASCGCLRKDIGKKNVNI